MLRTHYRQPIDWTVKGSKKPRRRLDDWLSMLGDMESRGSVAPRRAGARMRLRRPEHAEGDRRDARACQRNRRPGRKALELGTLKASAFFGLLAREADYLRSIPVARIDEDERRAHRRERQGARPRTSRNPTASATSSPRWASCWRITRTATTWKIKRRHHDGQTRHAVSAPLALLRQLKLW